MSEDTNVTEPLSELDAFKAQVLSVWAPIANEQNWNGEFVEAMRKLGYTDAQIAAARNAGQSVHTLTVTVRTARPFRINGGYGSLEDTVAQQVRRGFNLAGTDSVEVVHTTA